MSTPVAVQAESMPLPVTGSQHGWGRCYKRITGRRERETRQRGRVRSNQNMASTVNTVPVINITGESIALGRLRADLMETYERWHNDFETMRTQGDTP